MLHLLHPVSGRQLYSGEDSRRLRFVQACIEIALSDNLDRIELTNRAKVKYGR